MNNPAASGIKYWDTLSTYASRTIAIPNPINAVKAVRKLSNNALFLVNPPWINTPKSPISWGIS